MLSDVTPHLRIFGEESGQYYIQESFQMTAVRTLLSFKKPIQ